MRVIGLAAVFSLVLGAAAASETKLRIGYLEVERPAPPVLSNLDAVPEDLGLAGARLGLSDNATTGRFLGQTYTMSEVLVPEGGDAIAAARALLASSRAIVLDASAEVLTAIADLPEAQGALLFNATAPDAVLRDTDCRANLLHTISSDAMRADALAQFLVQRRWTDVALIKGGHPRDLAFAAALRASAGKFRLKLVGEKTWVFDADMRRNASAEVPLFTQDFRDHDVLLIADEIGDFGRYVVYNTWLPRPVAGSEELVPQAWAPVVEQWGAAQLQSRFEDQAGREMAPEDYAAWAALRALGEAVTRTGSDDVAVLRAYMLSGDFELAGFKGRPLSFRPWNGQLRQPIPIVTDRAVVATAPLEGFFHQGNELDTLGRDAPESACRAFEEH
ncbi:ABC transporter substrate-binding protein [Salipiger sp. P9]|uniref:ABC transporter substrate-binding protein n=1 Tax=Salipiger pentaromativorans TaxID=2943193 RepID=UPI002157410A|nr:ABC transporter substrate-binding protein [Salipiger pentaromativorans]MCR8547555.1 ABC transporter substrate-binding protein [Salipiger pentaromativorans]